MTREEQRELLDQFCDWLWDEYAGTCAPDSDDVADFLATLPKTCDGGSSPELPMDPYCIHGRLPANGQCPACAEKLGLEPQRFWRVDSMGERRWYWHPVDADGEPTSLHGKVGESFCSMYRATREEAEADGVASGLPRWEDKP